MTIKKELNTLMQARRDPRGPFIIMDRPNYSQEEATSLARLILRLLFIASSLLVNSIITLDNPDIREAYSLLDLFIAANSFNLGIYYWLFIVSWGLIIAGYLRILYK